MVSYSKGNVGLVCGKVFAPVGSILTAILGPIKITPFYEIHHPNISNTRFCNPLGIRETRGKKIHIDQF